MGFKTDAEPSGHQALLGVAGRPKCHGADLSVRVGVTRTPPPTASRPHRPLIRYLEAQVSPEHDKAHRDDNQSYLSPPLPRLYLPPHTHTLSCFCPLHPSPSLNPLHIFVIFVSSLSVCPSQLSSPPSSPPPPLRPHHASHLALLHALPPSLHLCSNP